MIPRILNSLLILISRISLLFPTISQKGFLKITKHILVNYLIVATVFFGGGLFYLFNPFGTKPTEAAWFNENWGYRNSISVTNNTTAENNVYIEITLDTAALTTDKLQADCDDLRFTKFSGEILPYFIVSGCDTGSTVIHIQFDTFPAGAQTIYYYYGNPSAASAASQADFSTEASDYTIGSASTEEKAPQPISYWRLDEGQGTSANDSTSNALNGTLNSFSSPPTSTSGWQTEDQCVSGKCIRFDGTGDYVSTANLNAASLTGFTFTFWIKTRATTGVVFDWAAARFCRIGQVTANKLNCSVDTTSGGSATTTSDVNDNEWHFITITSTAGSQTIYFDGVSQATTTETLSTTSGVVNIGKDVGGTAYTSMTIDEPKIYNYVRSAAQVLADYNARSNPEGAAAVLGASNNQPNTLSNGLVGYWKMDETSWTNNCSTASVLDSSGNGNNGTACPNSTGPTGGAIGKFGNAGSFDGSNDYVNVGSGSTITSLGAQGSGAMWIKPTALSTDFAYFMTIATVGFSFYVGSGSTTDNLRFFDGTLACQNSANNIPTGVWSHIAFAYDSSTVRLYLNGALIETCTGGDGSISGTGPVTIAGSTSNRYFNGSIDESRIYNRALSSADIAQLYNWGPGPYHYWKLDENTGQTVTDYGSLGDNGTLGADSSPSTDDPAWTPGKAGSALMFDGSSDYAQIGNAHLDGLGGLTIEAWVKRRAVNSLVTLGEVTCPTGSDPSSAAAIEVYSDGLIYGSLGNAAVTCSSGVPYATMASNDSNWHHVVFVFDGSQSTNATKFKGYLDGVQQTLSFGGGSFPSIINVADANFRLGLCGAVGGCASEWTDGHIDDVKIYNYPRTPGQIVEDMNSGHPAPGSPVGTPLGHWRFDEGYGITAANAGNGGAVMNGTLTTMASPATATSGWTQSGKFNKALVFDGSSDNVQVPNNTSWASAASITYTFWVRPTSVSGTTCMLCSRDNSTNAGFDVHVINGTVRFSTRISGGGTLIAGTLTNGNWQHMATTYDSVSRTLKTYINGRFINSAVATANPGTTSKPLTIGADQSSGILGGFFNGAIDEVKFYNFDLTADQVKIDMNQGKSQVLGALSPTTSVNTAQPQAAASEYCVPGDTISASCAAPVGRWDFEENTGTTVNDSTGNANTGTWNGTGTAHWKPGFTGSGSGGNFNGSDDYVNIPNSTSLQLSTAGTWSVWIKTSNGTGGVVPLRKGAADYQIDLTTNVARAVVRDAGGTTYTATGTTNISDGKWHHLTGLFSASSLRIYVDGKLDGTAPSAPAAIRTTSVALRFGADNTPSAFYTGLIDQVRIYNYTRTAAQIAWDYNKGGPAGYWRLDDCQGTTAIDSSGNNNPGTITIGGSGTYTTPGTCSASSASSAWFNGAVGKKNYSLAFDGTDDRVDINTSAGAISENQITVSAWVKATGIGDDRGIVGKANNSTWSNGYGIYTDTSSGNTFRFFINNFATNVAVSSTITTGTWYHVVGTYDGATIRIYLNGVLGTNDTLTGNISDGGTLQIATIGSWTSEFNGQIDDVKIFNYALTPTQIKSLYDGGAVNYGPVTGAP